MRRKHNVGVLLGVHLYDRIDFYLIEEFMFQKTSTYCLIRNLSFTVRVNILTSMQ